MSAGGATPEPGDRYATRLVLRDRRFVVVDVGHEDQKSVSFRLGEDGPGVRPGRQDASVTLRDRGIAVPSVLPRRGLIRIANRGDRHHAVVALKIRRGLSTAEASRWVRDGVEPARIGRRFELLGVVSAGTTNRVETQLPRGRYLLVSYHDGDQGRGLIAGVRVI